MGCLQAQRTRRNPRKNIWEELDQERLVRDAPDIEAILQQRAEVSVVQCFLGSALKITHCLWPSSATKQGLLCQCTAQTEAGSCAHSELGSSLNDVVCGRRSLLLAGRSGPSANLMHRKNASSAVDS